MPKPNAHLTMRLTQVTSNREPYRYTKLVIEDATSGLTIASLGLNPEQVVDLISGRLVGDVNGVHAWLIGPRERSLLGKMRGATTRRFPISAHEEAAVLAWCEWHGPAIGAGSWSVHQNSLANMHVATWHHYMDVRTQEELDAVMKRRQDTMDVLPDPKARV